jgi:hypothetical protein
MKDFRVMRSDLRGGKGYWSLWSSVGDNFFFPDGSRTDVGGRVNLQRDFKDVSDGFGKIWQLNTFFTPNVRLTTTETLMSYDDPDRVAHMVNMPTDKGKNLNFTVSMLIRVYYDPVELASLSSRSAGDGVAPRRMFYRQTSLTGPDPVEEVTLNTGSFYLPVAENTTATPETAANDPSEAVPFVFTPKIIAIIAVLGTILIAGIAAMFTLGFKKDPQDLDAEEERLRCARDGWHDDAATSREVRH